MDIRTFIICQLVFLVVPEAAIIGFLYGVGVTKRKQLDETTHTAPGARDE